MTLETVRCWTCSKETQTALDACPHCGASPYYLGEEKGTLAPRIKDDELAAARQRWIDIPEHIARQHRLYGVKGWATFFAATLLIGGFIDLVQLSTLLRDSWGPFRDGPAADRILGFTAVVAPAVLVSGYLVFAAYSVFAVRRDAVRHVLVGLVLVPSLYLLNAVYIRVSIPEYPYAVPLEMLMDMVWLSCRSGIWAFYFLESVRINVTIRHRVRIRDPFLRRVGHDADVRRALARATAPR